jgi:methylmalonyl-CoA carboxyltransferase 12S subunit
VTPPSVPGPRASSPSASGPETGSVEGELRRRLDELTHRVEWLEKSLFQGQPASPDVPPDVVLAICAAVAAALGTKATVRQVRLSPSGSWAQQGRAAVMSSHNIGRGLR